MKSIVKMANNTRKLLFTSNNLYVDLREMNERIKTLMGISILYTDSNLFDGCLKWDDVYKRPVIIVSNQDSYYRKEFTIAHELGHLLLHWKWNPSIDLTKVAANSSNILDTYKHPTMFRGLVNHIKGRNKLEKQADEFAANLLMPLGDIQRIYNKSNNKDLDYVKQIVSDELDVSTDAAYHRLNNLKKRGELYEQASK